MLFLIRHLYVLIVLIDINYSLYCFNFQPGTALKHAKEGTENSAFWQPIGGKKIYTSKTAPPETVKDPHLFSVSYDKGVHFFPAMIVPDL